MTVQSDQSSRVFQVLSTTFGYSSFRPLQREVMQAILGGRDILALMPTGGGKSLCYQVPALLLPGTTLVVSPLIALMKDQVDALATLGISATFINSSLAMQEVRRREAALVKGEYRLVYVAPERLMTGPFLQLLESVPVSLLAIDEAHCISEWGHDFRPEYRQLRRLRAAFPGVPTAAFTATATVRVQEDIVRQLGVTHATTFRGSFNRPNLFYDVRPKRNSYDELLRYLQGNRDASGIIYCGSRAGTEELATHLREDGMQAVAYHAGLENEERRQRQEAFSRDTVKIVVATVAFGMGIDKPDVRFVVHMDLPRTLENYYQESGRAGRDGDPSDCILFYSPGDVVKLRHFADEKGSNSERQTALWQVQKMADWAESTTCRRGALLEYFDEQFAGQEAPCCDVCSSPVEREDATVPAQKFLSCVKRTGERFGAGHVIRVLRGSRGQKVTQLRHDLLSTFGIGRDHTEEYWRDLARELVRGGYLHQDPDAFNALKVAERGRAVLFGRESVAIARRPSKTERVHEEQSNPELFGRLRALRKQIADERDVPPFVIFHDRTLRHMATRLPTTSVELLRIQGVGEQKAALLGQPFLDCVADFVRETGAEAPPERHPSEQLPPGRRPSRLSPTQMESLRLFREGRDIPAIASTRNLAESTVEGHLAHAVECGVLQEIEGVVSSSKQITIETAFDQLGTDMLGPVLEHLGPGYSYAELRFVRALRRRQQSAPDRKPQSPDRGP